MNGNRETKIIISSFGKKPSEKFLLKGFVIAQHSNIAKYMLSWCKFVYFHLS